MTVGFAKVSIKGEGVWLVGLDLMSARPLTSGLRIKSAMKVRSVRLYGYRWFIMDVWFLLSMAYLNQGLLRANVAQW